MVTLHMSHVAHRPVLNTTTNPKLPSFLPGTVATAARVADPLNGWLVDVDGSSIGLAITGLTATANGSWQYSQDGHAWQDIGRVSWSSALLLPSVYYVRFVPHSGFNGTAELRFRAWDLSRGTPGSRVSLLSGVLGSSFSTSDLIVVVWVNQALDFVKC
jgi:hypothetical protein